MARTQRITRINALLSRPQGATLAQMMEELEVSRATVNRDLQTMRDEMNAPIVWDRFGGSTGSSRTAMPARPTWCPACGSPRRKPMPS